MESEDENEVYRSQSRNAVDSEEEEEYEQDHDTEKGFVSFQTRQAKGILYKLNPLSDENEHLINRYVTEGFMQKDLRYARELFGLVNTSGRKDFAFVWESPWVEEHVRDTNKRKRQEVQQRSYAVKNFLKASSNHDTDNVDRFIKNVDRLTEWEEKIDSNEDIKTISRVVQSFEKVAVRQLVNFFESVASQQYSRVKYLVKNLMDRSKEGVSDICNTFRRSNAVFDLFANLVACEVNFADSTNGSKNLSIYANKLLESKRGNALLKLINCLDNIRDESIDLPTDDVGMPLMNVNFNVCISKGVIIVGKNSNKAVYVLDIQSAKNYEPDGSLNLEDVKSIEITQKFSASKNVRMELEEKKIQSVQKTKVHSLIKELVE